MEAEPKIRSKFSEDDGAVKGKLFKAPVIAFQSLVVANISSGMDK